MQEKKQQDQDRRRRVHVKDDGISKAGVKIIGRQRHVEQGDLNETIVVFAYRVKNCTKRNRIGTRVKSEITSNSSSARVTASCSTLKTKITKHTTIKIPAATCKNN